MQAGAKGITCQKIGEVEVFADAGCQDVLLTFNIIGVQKTDRLMTQMKRLQRLAVVLDNEAVAKGLSEAAVRHGTHVRYLSSATPAWGAQVSRPRKPRSISPVLSCGCRRMHFEGLLTFPIRQPKSGAFFDEALRLFTAPASRAGRIGRRHTSDLQHREVPHAHRASRGTYIFNDVMTVASGTATLGQLRDARACHRGEPTHRHPRGVRLRTKVLTSDLYTVTATACAGVPRRDHPAIFRRSTASSTWRARRESRRSARSMPCGAGTTAAWSATWSTNVYGVRAARSRPLWPVAARGTVR